MKCLITYACLFFGCVLPLSASAFGMYVDHDYTISGPGGRYGIHEHSYESSYKPNERLRTRVCLGPVGFTLRCRASRLLAGAVILAVPLAGASLVLVRRATTYERGT